MFAELCGEFAGALVDACGDALEDALCRLLLSSSSLRRRVGHSMSAQFGGQNGPMQSANTGQRYVLVSSAQVKGHSHWPSSIRLESMEQPTCPGHCTSKPG